MSSPDASPSAAAAVFLNRAERGALLFIVGLNIAFPVCLFIWGWPEPWHAFDGEQSVINWYSSVQCAALGCMALAVFAVTGLGRRIGTDPIPRSWPWLIVGFGFLFLSFDEKFQIHEGIREVYLKPNDIMVGLPFLLSGDIVLPLYALAGVVLSVRLVQDLRQSKRSFIGFFAALALIVLMVAQDSSSLKIWKVPAVAHVRIIVEEVGEIWSQALFGLSFVWFLAHKLRALLRLEKA